MFKQNSCIPFLFGVLIIQSIMIYLSMSSSNFTDQSALLAFKSAIHSNAILDGNWTKTTSFCYWVGITCSHRRERVTALNLSRMGLQGIISPQIGNLSFLVSLDLRNNSFYGLFPNEISHLFRLRLLVLQFNQLEGNIPASLCLCPKLEVIALTGNMFIGTIPQELGNLPKLRILYLGLNMLTGTIPPSISNLSTLEALILRQNSVTGSFPLAIFNISSLLTISLTANNISGSFPPNLCQNSPNNIQKILFSENKFSGQIPPGIFNCSELFALSLSYNRIHGSIPGKIGNSKKLEELYLGVNNLVGTIPSTIANMSMLKVLSIPETHITGNIPGDLVRLLHLSILDFAVANLTGRIPLEIFNVSSLQVLSLGMNSLSGNLPSNIGQHPNLEDIYLEDNEFTGNIPLVFSNFSKLKIVEFGYNFLTGAVPKSLGNLRFLQYLNLEYNELTPEAGNSQLSFLTALLNCRLLSSVHLDFNPLNSSIPDFAHNFSNSLQMLTASMSGIRGRIPLGIGSLKSLIFVDLKGNNLKGSIPSTIGGLEQLQQLYLDRNRIEGYIPEELCHLRQLARLTLDSNRITGVIPNCIGNLSRLQVLTLSSNELTSSIPSSLWSLNNIIFLNVSSNSLSGYIPENIRKSDVIVSMDLSRNKISGNIPSIIGAFESLSSLNLSRNLFEGPIPQSFGELKGMESLDLSHNNLSGQIPKSLQALRFLMHLNLSFNKLSGEVPTGGPFVNFTSDSFAGNKALCGAKALLLPPCASRSNNWKTKVEQVMLKYVLPGVAATVIFASVLYVLKNYQRGNRQIQESVNIFPRNEVEMISYQEIRLATNNFDESNLLGRGSFSSVYKGILSDGTTVAVKILKLELEGAFRSFNVECEVLRRVRHRNLVKVITSCSNPELRGLVLQFMSNGSLEKWLYSENHCLNLVERVSIMVDIGLAMEYLHHGQAEPIVHCDLKPSNILFDEDMVAHVSDFGIAKILAKNKNATQTKTLGTLGYIAPEYGSQGNVTTKADIYSFGILLMEIITAKKPVDEMFTTEINMRQWIAASLPDRVMGIVDAALLIREEAQDVNVTEAAVLSMMELGMECTTELPEERLNMRDAVVKLDKIKLMLQHRRTRRA